MNDFNPYNPPQTPSSADPSPVDRDEVESVWQEGKTLVMRKGAQLPNRCVKCNAPATCLLKKTYYWSPKGNGFLIIFLGPLVYLVVQLFDSRKATISVPLCVKHRNGRLRSIVIASIVACLGLILCFVPGAGKDLETYPLIGMSMIGVSLIFGLLSTRLLAPQKMDGTHVWLDHVSPEYIACLPRVPSRDNPDGNPHPLGIQI